MNYLTIGHLDFVPNKFLKGPDCDWPFIAVFTHKRNKRIYKQKKWAIGQIAYHKKLQKYSFIELDGWALGEETLFLIASIIYKLDNGELIFDSEKGELKNNE